MRRNKNAAIVFATFSLDYFAEGFSVGALLLSGSKAENLAILELGKLGGVSCMASGNDGKNLDLYGDSSSSLTSIAFLSW